MNDFTIDEGERILVEFAPRPGVRQVGAFDLPMEQLVELSSKALDSAMGTVGQMAQRVRALREKIPDEFTQIEVEFGIKLDAEAGALVAKAGGEAAINVTLIWERRDSQQGEAGD